MNTDQKVFGELNGQTVFNYTLTNDNGMEVSCINLGCVITKIITPDQNGNLENVVLGFDTLEEYSENPTFFGAVCGRVAGRISHAQFELEGNQYNLATNDGKHHLHGGNKGYSHVIWEGEMINSENEVGVEFTYVSPDGEEGYPGTLTIKVKYMLTNDNVLSVTYSGLSDKSTLFNPTNHTYFNLSGNAKHDILNHELTLKSDQFLELDNELIPTGERVNVENTAFDFQSGRKIIDGVRSEHPQNVLAQHGYDHPFLLNSNNDSEIKLVDSENGRVLVVETDQPCVVLYTANQMGEELIVNGKPSQKHSGVCLETQGLPDAIHHSDFPSVVLEKGQEFKTVTKFSFSVQK